MNSIADALVYAIAHVACREESEDFESSDDEAMSHIMAYLSDATPDEEEALAAAAERALAEEQSLHYPQQEMIDFFRNWMRCVFGPDWDGNQRA